MAAKVKWDREAWWIFTHHHGKRTKKRIGPTKAHKRQAEGIAKKINAALALGTFGAQNERSVSPTLRELADRWLRVEIDVPLSRGLENAVAPKTARLYRGHLEARVIPCLGDRYVREIGVAEVQSLYEACLQAEKKLSTRTIDMTIATLGRVLAYAEAQEIVAQNAVASWRRARGRRRSSGPQPVPRERVLDGQELERFLSTAREHFPAWFGFILFLADTGARLGEASALRWIDVDLEARRARIARSFSDGQFLSPPKTRRERTVELSARLGEALVQSRPDLFGDDTLVFPNETGHFIDPHNFRARVFRRIVTEALGRGRDFSPHGLRHTFASLHLARGTNLKWIQTMGGWASAKLLLDLYGHYLPTESGGNADALSDAPKRPYTAPLQQVAITSTEPFVKKRTGRGSLLAPRAGLEPATRCLEGSCSIQLSYRGQRKT